VARDVSVLCLQVRTFVFVVTTTMFSTFAPMFSRPLYTMRSLANPSGCQRNLFSTSRTLFHTRPGFYSRQWQTAGSAPVKQTLPFIYKAAGVSALGLGISFFTTPSVHCDAPVRAPTPVVAATSPPPPESIVNLYELGFGTVCGLCAGVFVKKGAKALAFVLGGVFVLLQYLGSLNVLRVDWIKMGSRFENLFYTTDARGQKQAPSASSTWNWLVDFLTADFQKRASFIAGLALGLRVG